MLRVLLLGVLAPAGLGLPAPPEPQPLGGQCVDLDCFAVFRGPATFLAASRVCERLQGHLMTVRSSVAEDVISLLLSGDGPRLWIGLQRPPGCDDPEHSGPLRGFQWVTGDNRTSFSRWARPREDGERLCGPLCVAVSAAAGALAPGEPAWEERPCDAEADGFLCEFHFAASCRPLAVEPGATAAAGLSITYGTPFGARGADFQALPLGSTAAVAPLGVELECAAPLGETEGRWSREAPGAWACGVERGGCQHECKASAGASNCLCPADAALQADGRSCGPPAEHPCHQLCEHFCHLHGLGNYTCICEAGYQLAADQHRCEDVDDCAQVPSPCPQSCVNTEGGFQCHCFPDFDLVDGECVEPVDPCFGNNCEYQCQPVGRSEHQCICAEGFAPVPGALHKCRMFCNQTSCPADCDPHNPAVCWCPEGYILDEGSVCTDINECDNGICPGQCHNLPGTYECICGPDSALSGTDCDPIQVNEGQGTLEDNDGSGEPPVSPTPGGTARPSPAPAGPLHSGVLVGISIASLSLVVAFLALLCHLRKKQGASRGELEYKCGVPAKELMLQQVKTERTPQKL